MAIKDEMFLWFIRNIIIPRNEIIDKPGYIILKIGEKKDITNLREIILSADLIADIEEKIHAEYGSKGDSLLYSTGKKFGYRFAQISGYPNYSDSSRETVEKFIYFAIKYLEAIYAKKIEYELDYEKRTFDFDLDNYIVCSRNGLGYILTEGAITGVCSYEFNDPAIEGKQTKCQGRKDEKCKVFCGPKDFMKGICKGSVCYNEENMSGLEINRTKYNKINALRTLRWSKNSLKKLIDASFVKYKQGNIEFLGERQIIIESSLMYILEKQLSSLKDGNKILWNCCFEWGKKISEKIGGKNPSKMIMDMFPGFGYGDFYVSSNPLTISISNFPWTRWHEDIDFIILRGIMSGIFSQAEGKRIEIGLAKKRVSSSGFSLIFKEKSEKTS